MATKESVTLYFKSGGSDKVYHAFVEEAVGGFVVNFAFGRRGASMQTGCKTPTPVPYAEAKKVFDKLVSEKTGKGYTPGLDGTPYSHTDKAPRASGVLPQLLNPIDESEAERYLADAAYWMQEKIDGKRIALQKEDGAIVGINRSGLTVALPAPILARAQAIKGDFLLDGEAVGDRFIAFDCLALGKVRLEAHTYRDRWSALADLVRGKSAIEVLTVVTKADSKRDYLRYLRQANREGAVFKRHDAPYTPGRPNSGGPQVKLKFTATASCIVGVRRNGKRSVGIEVLDGNRRVHLGNVTIPPNQPIPVLGDIAEVRYLYAYLGGALFQPVYLGRRDDIPTEQCTVAQLKFKRADEEADA